MGSRSEDYWTVLYGNGTGTLVAACVVLHACWDFLDAREGGQGNCMCYYRFRSVMDGRRLNFKGQKNKRVSALYFDLLCSSCECTSSSFHMGS